MAPLNKAVSEFLISLYLEMEYPDGRVNWNIWSGFVVEKDSSWVLITAGHPGVDIQVATDKHGARIKRFGLFEFGELQPKGIVPELIVIPEKHEGGHFCQDGADVGCILLSQLPILNLKACGVKPIPYAALAPGNIAFDEYFLAGIFKEGVTPGMTRDRFGQDMSTLGFAPIVAPLTYLGPDASCTIKRLSFEILLDELTYDGRPIESIVGMSGGPVLGVSHAGGESRFMVVAIQSSWIRAERKLFACPAAPLVEALLGQLNTTRAE